MNAACPPCPPSPLGPAFAPGAASPPACPQPVRRLAALALLGAMSVLLSACERQGAHDAGTPAASGAAGMSAPASAAARVATADPGAAAASLSAAAAGLGRADLMRAVFPRWHEGNDPGARDVEVELPERDDAGRIRRADGAAKTIAARVEIAPREVIRLDDTHAVMLTEGVSVDDGGVRDDSYASGAWLGAYFFRRDAAGWVLERRVDGVDYLGVAGTLGETSVARIGAGEFGLVVTGGGCWQGFCGTWASVYGIRPGRIATYASTIPTDGNNLGASGDCDAALKAAEAAHGAASETDLIATADAGSPPSCFDINGKLSLAAAADGTSEMRIHFDGAQTSGPGDEPAVRLIHQTAVYRLRDGKYMLASGRNPVPAF
ncbi:hypothetical protein EXE55_19580 [Burkholderia glumae]|uniref:hypothetical protein n=1 Tax=Burkholderia glumae TaxID=337 RepID=UPI001373A38F|nr:hypothetical protein [Burkholderia glumae]MCR1770425.1 hypothetical protein [Burkholderia glumae]QHP93145.1 hypothetical protein EXE55_19580 [Burkholderia glumae]